MTPEPCFSIAGRKARSRRTAAKRFVSKACCQSSSDKASAPPPCAAEPPALWIRISKPPNWLSTCHTTLSTPARVLISAWTNNAAAWPSGRGERAVVATVAPAAARRRTTASPTPLVPPVISARLPPNSASKRMPDVLLIGGSPFVLSERLAYLRCRFLGKQSGSPPRRILSRNL